MRIKMDRTIKFRGKNLYNNEWIFGDLIQYESGEMAIFSKKLSQYGCEATEMFNRSKAIPETVGQFTGVKYNDREIYEHDLVECSGVLCEIVCNDKIGAFVLLEVLTQNLGNKPIGQMLDMFDIKYVGNIYDNLELIKEE